MYATGSENVRVLDILTALNMSGKDMVLNMLEYA